MLRAIMMKRIIPWSSSNYGTIINITGVPYLTRDPQNPALYRSRHASSRTVIECCARNYASGRFRRYRINDILQTAKEAVDPDGTAFFQ